MEKKVITISTSGHHTGEQKKKENYQIIDLTDKNIRTKKKIVICCGKETGSGTNFGQCITSVF